MSPSNRHTELRNMASTWLDNKIIKIAFLPEANFVGYVADLVAIACMQDAPHTRYARYSNLKKMSMSTRMKADYKDREVNDRFERIITGDIDRWYVCIFEVKISREDFLGTFGGKTTPHAKARMAPVGTAHWVVADKNICKPEELPDFWGLLEPYGTGLTEKKIPKLNILSKSTIHTMAFEMLWLRMNYRTSYFDQLKNMSEKVNNLHRAILKGKPTGELLRRSNRAVKACQGFI